MTTTATPRLLTVAEAAERLRVSKPTIYRRIGDGTLPAVRLGNAFGPLRILEDELEAWLLGEPGTELAKVAGAVPAGDPAGAPRPAGLVEGGT